MDTIRAINHAILKHLVEDNDLTTLMGNTNINEGLAGRSDVYPYIVYAVDPHVPPETPVVADCGFQVDIWDRPEDNLTVRIYEIRGRLIKLLDQHILALYEDVSKEMTGEEAQGIRIYLNSMGVILRDPDDEFVQHIVTIWTLRFIRSEDLVY